MQIKVAHFSVVSWTDHLGTGEGQSLTATGVWTLTSQMTVGLIVLKWTMIYIITKVVIVDTDVGFVTSERGKVTKCK